MSAMFKDHFSGVAAQYADFRPRYPAALFDYLAGLAPKNGVAWDCAAGNGQASLDLATRLGRVIATDASREQLAAAPPHSKIEYRVAAAEQSGLPEASVSLITVAQALHWFDLPRFYAEAGRVLVSGGVIAVWAYGINQMAGGNVNELVQDYYTNTVGPYWPPERALVEDGYQSINFPFAEMTPPLFRMEADWTLGQLLGYLSTWSATNRFIKARGFNPLESLAGELGKVWGDGNSPRQVVWPLALRVGRKL